MAKAPKAPKPPQDAPAAAPVAPAAPSGGAASTAEEQPAEAPKAKAKGGEAEVKRLKKLKADLHQTVCGFKPAKTPEEQAAQAEAKQKLAKVGAELSTVRHDLKYA